MNRYWLPRPRFEDGKPVERGDLVLANGETARVRDFHVSCNGSFWLDLYVFKSGTTIGKSFESGERVKRPESDTWERVEADVDNGKGYAGMDKAEAMADVLRRCKALAEVE